MKDKLASLTGALLAAAGAAPTGMTAGVLSLLGLAGSAATSVAGWLAPVLVGVSFVFLGRAFYILYVRRCGSRASHVITWLSAAFVIGFWTWRLVYGGFPSMGVG